METQAGLALKISAPAVLLLFGLALAPLLGGHVLLDAEALDPSNFARAAFWERSIPATGHFVIAAFILGAFVVAVLSRNVFQVPVAKLLAASLLLWLWLGMSIIESKYKHQSIFEFARWTSYILTLFACVAILGRTALARGALLAILSGTSLMALTGISEFLYASVSAPNWRIFAGWQNSNAAAGMFAIVIPFGVALHVSSKDAREKLLIGIACICCMAALWLTASKGGLLACAFGILVFVCIAAMQRLFSRSGVKTLTALIVGAGVLVLCLTLLARFAIGSRTATGGGRLFAASVEKEQSVGFRVRLWKDSFSMARASPTFGTGLGTFGAEIKKHTETQGSAVAHNSYLQLAAEGGFPALLVFLVLAVAWCSSVFAKNRGLPEEFNVIKLGIVGSVASAMANLLVESNLSYFGFSTVLFALMGIGLLFAVDGVMPERPPFLSRIAAGAIVSFGALYYLGAGAVTDYYLSAGLFKLKRGDAPAASEDFKSAMSASPADPQAYAQLARISAALGDVGAGVAYAKRAIALGPTASRYVILADIYQIGKDPAAAERTYENAIAFEPKNPYFLRRYFEYLRDSGAIPAAIIIARQLVAMDDSVYFRATALPWLVNTDTVAAHEFLAAQSKNAAEKASQLQKAFDILRDYARKTYPELLRMTGYNIVEETRLELKKKTNTEPTDAQLAEKLQISEDELREFRTSATNARIAGESLETARQKFFTLREIGRLLSATYRRLGDGERERRVESALRELEN